MATWSLGNAVPRLHRPSYVDPTAHVIGDVTPRTRASVWPGAVLRADFGQIDAGEGSSVQDNCKPAHRPEPADDRNEPEQGHPKLAL